MIDFTFQEGVEIVENSKGKSENVSKSGYQIFDSFVVCTAMVILLLSFIWLLANSAFKKAEIRQTYSKFVSFIFLKKDFRRAKERESEELFKKKML